jgi:hypothetical protein
MHCRWDSSDGAHSVILSCGLVEELRTSVVDAFLSLPRRGAEVGGLLLGRFLPGSPAGIQIEAMEEVPCEHRYGPSYVLSDDDRAHFRQRLARPLPEGSPQVVGFYRSYTRRDAVADAADVDLFYTFLPDERSVLLVIEPLSPAECFATFLFRENGELPDHPPYPFFTFAAEAMQQEAESVPAVVASPAQPPPAAEPEPSSPAIRSHEPDRDAPAPPEDFRPLTLPPSRRAQMLDPGADTTDTRPRPRRRFWLPLAACVVLGAGGGMLYEFWKLAREPQWAELRLDATASTGSIQLTWDRDARALKLSTGAVLHVTDGSTSKSVDLSPADLLTGKLTYHASHPDVLFRMQLHGTRGRAWSDSLRVVSVNAPPPAPAPAAPPSSRTPVGEAARAVPAPALREKPEPRASAAVAIQQVQPEIPEGIRSRIGSRVVIPVQVRVNEAGRVISAVPRTKGDSVSRYLGDAAAKAARSWRFTPARSREGAPIASSKTLEFTFAPGGPR